MALPKPPKARQLRRCIFCGASANSKEHFWPVWSHEIVAKKNFNGTHSRQLHSFHPSTGKQISGPDKRQGGVQTIRIRAVCRECNHGWMNGIEQAVRPTLTAMAMGAEATFDAADLLTIARWVALKCIVAEHDKPRNALTPHHDREAFMLNGEIPDYFRIYAALNVSGEPIGYVRHTHAIALTPEGPKPPVTHDCPRNIQTFTFMFGKAVFHVNAARIDGLTLESRTSVEPIFSQARLWPPQHTPWQWPRRPAIDVQGIGVLAGSLKRYIDASSPIWL